MLDGYRRGMRNRQAIVDAPEAEGPRQSADHR